MVAVKDETELLAASFSNMAIFKVGNGDENLEARGGKVCKRHSEHSKIFFFFYQKTQSMMRARMSAGVRSLSSTVKSSCMSGPGRLLLTRGLPPLTIASVFASHFAVII